MTALIFTAQREVPICLLGVTQSRTRLKRLSSSNSSMYGGGKRGVPAQLLSRVRLFATPWTAAHQASLSMGFPRQESCRGSPFPPPRNLPDPRIEPMSPASIGSFFIAAPPGKPTCLLAFNKSGILDTSQHLGFFTQHYNRRR